jgi:tagatose-1,6-bisphosphate aldolase
VNIFDRAVRLGMRNGWQRGVVEGRSVWAVVGGLALLGYVGRRAMRRDAQVIFSDVLAPGESLKISHETPS